MAYVDKRLEFSVAQALTATAVSTNIIDLGEDRDIGVGAPLWWTTELTVATDGTTGDETYVADLQTDDNSSFSSPTIIASITIPRSTAAGARYSVGFPLANERYVRVNYTLGGTTPTVTLNSRIGLHPPAWQGYPSGTTQAV